MVWQTRTVVFLACVSLGLQARPSPDWKSLSPFTLSPSTPSRSSVVLRGARYQPWSKRRHLIRQTSSVVYASAVPDSEVVGVHGPIFRHPSQALLQPSADDQVHNGFENFNRGLERNPNGNCLGYRQLRDGVAGPFTWMTYTQVAQRRDNFASGLEHLGSLSHKFLGIISVNRPEWVIAEQAANRQGATVAAFYDSWDAATIKYAIELTQLETIVCNLPQLPTVAQAAQGTTLKFVVAIGDILEAHTNLFKDSGVRLMSFTEVEELGVEHLYPPTPGNLDDIATFCFTSGTTGVPKAAMISNSNQIATLKALNAIGIELTPTDIHLSYLPLSHTLERSVQYSIFYGGGAVGFFQGDSRLIPQDLVALRPTIFPSVPRLLSRFYDQISYAIRVSGTMAQKGFDQAYAAKLSVLRQGQFTHPWLDTLVFRGIKTKVGLDRVRLMLTGSAPIADSLLDFLRVVFACPVLQGYGLTETTAVATLTSPQDTSAGHVGGPVPSNEITLMDVPEMGYLSTDRIHSVNKNEQMECLGRGEVAIRGANIFQGYYKQSDKTAESLTDQGWLLTGDVGLWMPNGALKIIDRKKNIFKLSQGEYVAPEKLEDIYGKAPLVLQSFVYGDSHQAMLVAIIVPNPEMVALFAKQVGWSGAPWEFYKDPRLVQGILKQMNDEADKAQLNGFERVKAIALEPRPWMPGDPRNLLTPTFKLRRNAAALYYRKQIDELYASLTRR